MYAAACFTVTQYIFPHVAWWLAGDLGREYGLSAANANLEDLSATGQVNGLHNNDEHLEHQPTFKEPYDAHGKRADIVKQASSYI